MIGPFYIIGIELRTSNAEAAKTIPALWERFYREGIREKVLHRSSDEIYALYTDYEGDHTKSYTIVIGCKANSMHHISDDLSNDMVGKFVPAQAYEVYTAKGTFPDSLLETWHKIWQAPIQRTFQADFEVYPPHFNPQENPGVNVYIGVKEVDPYLIKP